MKYLLTLFVLALSANALITNSNSGALAGSSDTTEITTFTILNIIAMISSGAIIGSILANNHFYKKALEEYGNLTDEMEKFKKLHRPQLDITVEAQRLHKECLDVSDKTERLKKEYYEL